MSKADRLLTSEKYRNIRKNFTEEKSEILDQFVLENLSTIKLSSKRLKCFLDILKNNDSEYFKKYDLYYHGSALSYNALVIRYGTEEGGNRFEQYKQKLRSRPKISRKDQNNFDAHSLSKRLDITLEEANIKISNAKARLSASGKNSHKKKKENGFNYREINPLCIEYWLKQEYDKETAYEKYTEAIKSSRTTLYAFQKRYGNGEGKEKYKVSLHKRKETFLAKYGTTFPSGGRTSKQSLKFFIPLYKQIRKLGIKKEDICWGIKGSREFAITKDSTSFCYDFTIKSLKYIIEYNGSFWHSHPDKKYTGFIDEETVIKKDLLKRKVIEDRGFLVRYVWDFENFYEMRNIFLKEIRELHDRKTDN